MENLNKKDVGEVVMDVMSKMMDDMMGEILGTTNDYEKIMKLWSTDNIKYLRLSTIISAIYNRSKTICDDGGIG